MIEKCFVNFELFCSDVFELSALNFELFCEPALIVKKREVTNKFINYSTCAIAGT